MPIISYNFSTKVLSGSGFSNQTDWTDGYYYTKYGYEITFFDAINGIVSKETFFETSGSFDYIYDIPEGTTVIVYRGYEQFNPENDPPLWKRMSTESAEVTVDGTSTPSTLTISVSASNGIGTASSITMETQVVHSITGIANGIGGALPMTMQLLDILQINGLASGIGGTVGTVQVVSNVNRIIKGTVNLNGSPTQGATVIAVEPSLLKSYKATTLSDGSYEIYVNDVGTYHVLSVYEDGVGNKYGAMIQPYVEIAE